MVTAHRPGFMTYGDGMLPVGPDTVTNAGTLVGFNCTYGPERKLTSAHARPSAVDGPTYLFTINFCSMLMLFGVSGVTVTSPTIVSSFRFTYFNTIR